MSAYKAVCSSLSAGKWAASFKAVFADEGDPRSAAALSGLLSAITERELRVERVLQNEPATGFAGEKQIRSLFLI